LVIATAAIRGCGTSNEYLTPDYPAVADFSVVSALHKAAKQAELRHHIGVVQSKDSFYGETDPNSMPVADYLNERWKAYLKAGCLASEMEAAALFCAGLTRNVRVGCVLTAIWNVERAHAGLDNPEFHDSSRAIGCAVEAIKILMRC
jgi:uridine phosphorylase